MPLQTREVHASCHGRETFLSFSLIFEKKMAVLAQCAHGVFCKACLTVQMIFGSIFVVFFRGVLTEGCHDFVHTYGMLVAFI